MKVRPEILKARSVSLLAGAMAIAAVSGFSAKAADQGLILKAPPPAVDEGWYFHGGLEVGGRAYIERPGSGFGYNADGSFLLPKQTDSRAKYEEYGKVPPGLFLDWFKLDIGSNDGRYRFNVLGKDVGYNAQSYNFDFSEAGKQYLSLSWDQTPHLYSTSAKSLFSGVGSTNLTVDPTVQQLLQPRLNNAAGGTGVTAAQASAAQTAIKNAIYGNATQLDIGIRRDKFSGAYRITPTPDWDFDVSYSHEDRTGTKPGTLNWGYTHNNPSATIPPAIGPGFPSNVIGIPVPVDDTTQKPKASGEYIGSSPLGRFNVKLGYAGSFYRDNITSLDVQNPFCLTCNMTAPFNVSQDAGPNLLRLGLPPSNSANAFTASGATDVPLFKSRYTTTNQWSVRKQDDAFIQSPYASTLGAGALPGTSLNGEVKTFLTNNILTSTLADTWHNKVSVRYYDFDNGTTPLNLTNVVFADTEINAGGTPEYTSYKKTNFNEDLTWDPWHWLTLGAGYGFERWDRSDNRFVTRSNENIGSMFANAKLTKWAQWRISYSYGSRRHDSEYFIDEGEWLNSRMFDLANRNQQRARTLLDITVTDAITVTPNAGLRWTDYPDDTLNQTGVSHDHAWNAGVDVGMVVSPALRLMAGYNYERVKLDMAAAVPDAGANSTTGVGPCSNGIPLYQNTTFTPYTIPPPCLWEDNLTQTYHTFVASADWKAIPSKLDFRLNYIASWSREAHDFTPCSLNNFNCNGVAVNGSTAAAQGLPWPDNTSLYQRLDATGRYYFDKEFVEKFGWKGQAIFKLRYTVERNQGSFWQSDAVNAYFGTLTGNTELTGTSRSIFLAYNNPNYTAQLLAASLALKW